VIDLGQGDPIVLVPGVQGRWEWMAPAVRAVSRSARAISYSLAGDPGSGRIVNPRLGFETFTRQLGALLDRLGLERASMCGVSLGGLIALHYAAGHPQRVSALVLVSAPGPSWRPDRRSSRYMRHPLPLAPMFIARSPLRMWPEIAAAHGSLAARLRFSATHVARILAAPMSPKRMAERVRFAGHVDLLADCAQLQAPTLVVTGEPALDRVVPVESTREYLQRIPGSRGVVLERTGHIGLVTRPDRFAAIVTEFVRSAAQQVRSTS
jgi:pimeloyl-ACP methyl ester carboxylesterase